MSDYDDNDASEEEDSDLDLSSASFLLSANLEPDYSQKKRSKKRSLDIEDEEASYEQQPRRVASSRADWKSQGVARLPTKSSDGTVRLQRGPSARSEQVEARESGSHSSDEDNGVDDDNDYDDDYDGASSGADEADTADQVSKRAALLPRLTPAEIRLARARVLASKKFEMAELAESILAEPEAGVSTAGGETSKLQKLLALSEHEDMRVRKLAMLSLLAVFKDVLPGYRIRLPTAKEKAARTTKEVRLLRTFERRLLNGYHAFLKMLNQRVMEGLATDTGVELPTGDQAASHASPQQRKLAVIAVRCMCTMVLARPRFNFQANLLAAVVPRINSTNDEVASHCEGCIRSLFLSDTTGESTLEVVRAVAKLTKSRGFGVGGHRNLRKRLRPEVIRVLFALPLEADLKDDARAAEARRRKAARKRKRRKGEQSDGVDESLAEADASRVGDRIARHATQAEVLREVFALFLRVLKNGPESPLLQLVLEGISRFVHLVHLDLAQALLQILAQYCAPAQAAAAAASSPSQQASALRRSPGAALQCVRTVLLTLQGPGRELRADESVFAQWLYETLLRLLTPGGGGSGSVAAPTPGGEEEASLSLLALGERHVLLAVECVETLLLRRAQVSNERVAAFVRRMSLLALHASPPCALALVSSLRALMHRFPGTRRLVEDEAAADAVGRGGGGGSDGQSSLGGARGGYEVSAALMPISKKERRKLAKQRRRGGGGGGGSSSSTPAAEGGVDPAWSLSGDGKHELDVDHSASLVRPCWGLAQLRFHYHPALAAAAEEALRIAPLLPAQRPTQIFRAHLDPLGAATAKTTPDASGGAIFNPPLPTPRRAAAATIASGEDVEASKNARTRRAHTVLAGADGCIALGTDDELGESAGVALRSWFEREGRRA